MKQFVEDSEKCINNIVGNNKDDLTSSEEKNELLQTLYVSFQKCAVKMSNNVSILLKEKRKLNMPEKGKKKLLKIYKKAKKKIYGP